MEENNKCINLNIIEKQFGWKPSDGDYIRK